MRWDAQYVDGVWPRSMANTPEVQNIFGRLVALEQKNVLLFGHLSKA
jgi:hypothetical protein